MWQSTDPKHRVRGYYILVSTRGTRHYVFAAKAAPDGIRHLVEDDFSIPSKRVIARALKQLSAVP
jgi:hypothetical protein